MNAKKLKQIVNRQKIKNLFIMVPLIFMIIATSGCGNNMEGVYVDPKNKVEITLKPDYTAYTHTELMGISRETAGTYKIDDKKLLLTVGGETTVFNIHDDGSFSLTDGFFNWHLKKVGELKKNEASATEEKLFTDTKKIADLFIKFRTSSEVWMGTRANPAWWSFVHGHMYNIENFKIIKGYKINQNEHFIEFSYDMVCKLSQKDLDDQQFKNKIIALVGEEEANDQIEDLKKRFQTGKLTKNRHFTMKLKKFDSGWEIVDVGMAK